MYLLSTIKTTIQKKRPTLCTQNECTMSAIIIKKFTNTRRKYAPGRGLTCWHSRQLRLWCPKGHLVIKLSMPGAKTRPVVCSLRFIIATGATSITAAVVLVAGEGGVVLAAVGAGAGVGSGVGGGIGAGARCATVRAGPLCWRSCCRPSCRRLCWHLCCYPLSCRSCWCMLH